MEVKKSNKRGKMVQNRLGILLHKIAVENEKLDLVDVVIDKLAEECDVLTTSVRRWVRNASQPPSTALNKIIEVLAFYDKSITVADFYVTQSPSKPTRKVSQKLTR